LSVLSYVVTLSGRNTSSNKKGFLAVKRAFLFLVALTFVMGFLAIPFAVNADNSSSPDLAIVAQGGPTATPLDPSWLGFATARDALAEKLKTRIQLVNRYTWAQTEFTYGIVEGCTTLAKGAEAPKVYFGWRYIITLLNNNQYEVRVSFDLKNVYVCDKVTVDASGGGNNGGGGKPGNVVPGKLETGAQVQGLGASSIATLKSAEMKWFKIQVHAGDGNAANYIAQAKANGFKILISVLGDPAQIMNAGYQDTYATYVAGLAQSGADAIEIHNEPNIDREWPAGQINGANYTALLKKAYPAIKAKNSNTIVITGAPAPTGFFGAAGCTSNGCNDDVFYKQMAAAGAGQFADCIGIHYNEGVVSPKVTSGDPRDNYPTRYFQTMLNRAMSQFPGMKACFTELGYLTPEGYGALPGQFAWGANTSIAEQAQWLAEAAVLGSQLGNVRLIIVFNLDFKLYGADPQAGYAMVRADGTCPACTTLAAAQ
jgi:hypothetical protein